MKLLISLFFFTAICQDCFSQLIDLKIETRLDTVKISEELTINIEIKNVSNKSIFIPADFFVTSNILPNGLENNVRGFYMNFTINPVSTWSTIHIENTGRSNYNEFLKIKPQAVKKFSYDLNQHINYFNNNLTTDSLKVPLNKQITISAQYFNNRLKPRREDRTAVKKVSSNPVNIVLVE